MPYQYLIFMDGTDSGVLIAGAGINHATGCPAHLSGPGDPAPSALARLLRLAAYQVKRAHSASQVRQSRIPLSPLRIRYSAVLFFYRLINDLES
jgi:hypothetical protein